MTIRLITNGLSPSLTVTAALPSLSPVEGTSTSAAVIAEYGRRLFILSRVASKEEVEAIWRNGFEASAQPGDEATVGCVVTLLLKKGTAVEVKSSGQG